MRRVLLAFRLAFAVAAFGPLALASASPAGAQSASNYDFDVTYDVDPPYAGRPCPMSIGFSATITAKDPEPGLPTFPVSYYWVVNGKRAPGGDRHMQVDGATGQSNTLLFRDLMKPFRGVVKFVVIKPFQHTFTSDDLDIICH